MPIAFSIVCALALGVVLYAEHTGKTSLRRRAKPIASAAFIAVALSGGALGAGDYAHWVIIGLVFGAGGDVALMYQGRKAFLIGLVLFLLGHVGYVIACVVALPISEWGWWFAVPSAASALALAYLWTHLGPMRGPVLVYLFVITAMVTAAIEVALGEPALHERAALLAALGAVFFYASDLTVARQRFVVESFANRAWGLPAYYIGQLLFAWSAIQ